jgi:hypothetical protein
MAKTAYACVVALALGAAGGWMLRGADTTEQMAGPTGLSAALPLSLQSRPSASAMIDMAQLRAVLQEELTAALSSRGQIDRPAAQASVAPAPATPELQAQRREILQQIDGMLASGQWGNRERLTFQQGMAMLDPEQAERLLQQVTRSLIDGTVKVTTDGPPL